MQKRQQKRDRERLEEARRPFEELNEQYVGFNETTGGIELMIGGKKQEKAARQSLDRHSHQTVAEALMHSQRPITRSGMT